MAPATFNTGGKRVHESSTTLAVGILNKAIELGVPSLRSHPKGLLRMCGKKA